MNDVVQQVLENALSRAESDKRSAEARVQEHTRDLQDALRVRDFAEERIRAIRAELRT